MQREFAPRVAAIRDDLPQLHHLVVAEDGSGASVEGLESADYEDAVAAASPASATSPSARTTTST